ncbi:hypothetical protein V6N12_024989 [Hibiscus sabdariffa]|uniref:Bulb-type lectin domain-containing protein n=1 Tax=Hibiscus sabdariffa TaxID=183260 RepID=A0ABR2AVX5_9ROSI
MYFVKWLIRILLIFILSHFSFAADTITLDHFIQDNNDEVIVSAGNIFALGFFSPATSTTNRYVGIWYYQIPVKTVIWVANRDNPINDASGILRIDARGNLALFQGNQTLPVWSTNISTAGSGNSFAQILDSGNLVLLQNDTGKELLWQSFGHPTNTWLSHMKIGFNLRTGLNQTYTSWKSPDDPGVGNYTFRMNPGVSPQMVLYKGSVPVWRSGTWTGKMWSGIPEMAQNFLFNDTFVDTDDELSFSSDTISASLITRYVTNETGVTQRILWNNASQSWSISYTAPNEPCDFYGHCGPNVVPLNGGTERWRVAFPDSREPTPDLRAFVALDLELDSCDDLARGLLESTIEYFDKHYGIDVESRVVNQLSDLITQMDNENHKTSSLPQSQRGAVVEVNGPYDFRLLLMAKVEYLRAGHKFEYGASHKVGSVGDGIRIWNIDPDLQLIVSTLALLFESAFSSEVHQIKKCMTQMFLLAGPRILSKRLSIIIEGESLMNGGTTFVIYMVFYKMVLGQSLSGDAIIETLANVLLRALCITITFGISSVSWLEFIFIDTLIENTFTLVVSFIVYFTVQEGFFSNDEEFGSVDWPTVKKTKVEAVRT